MMRADLHVHSLWSDGSDSVETLFRKARNLGLSMLSITDHDTTIGTEEALYWGKKLGIEAVPGLEISAMDPESGSPVHILGYHYNQKAENIEALCRPVREKRHETTLKQAAILKEAGYPVDEQALRRIAGPSPVFYKQHLMQILINEGYCQEIYSDLYRKLFKGDGPCRIDIPYVDMYKAVKAIVQDGGVAVLAHPGLQDSLKWLPSLVDSGLWGMELFHEGNDLPTRKKIREYADSYGLVLTGGSDDHGSYGSFHSLGEITVAAKIPFPGKRTIPQAMSMIKKVMEECGQILRIKAGDIQNPQSKGDPADLVTTLDLEVEKSLVQAIQHTFPEDGLITEEADRGGNFTKGNVWIIDPIDGTSNFVHKGYDFSISVACYRKGEPWFGLVYDVMNNTFYEAVSGKGAWINGVPVERTTEPILLSKSLIDFSLHSVKIMKERFQVDLTELIGFIRGHRALGCASLILCQLALGVTNIYLSAKLSIWDYAAADLFLKECNGDSVCGKELEPQMKARSPRVYIAGSSPSVLDSFLEHLYEAGLPKKF